MKILIFHPDAPDESPFAGLRKRRHVKNEAAHFAQKLPPHKRKFVVTAVESVRINEHHLQEAFGQVLFAERKEISHRGKRAPLAALRLVQRYDLDAVRIIRAPEQIFVAV